MKDMTVPELKFLCGFIETYITKLLFYGLDNSSIFEVRIECKRLKLVSASLSEITTKHISREFYDNV